MAVDGGRQQVEELQPVINGVVLPAVSFALGTLSATSIQSLRQRQVSLRACLNREACLIDLLSSALDTIFDGPQRHAEKRRSLQLLRAYACRVVAESRQKLDVLSVDRKGAADSELRSLSRMLHRSPGIREGLFHEAGLVDATTKRRSDPSHSDKSRSGVAEPRFSEPRFFVTTEFTCQASVKELLLLRSERLALLLTTFPPLFWLTQCLLSGSIVLAFLVETDIQSLQFLDLLQLRLLFTILVSALTGIGMILWDLNEPFRGSFNINSAGLQLHPIVAAIDELLVGTARDMRGAASDGETGAMD